MLRLASVLYSVIGSTLAGTMVVVALVIGQDTLVPILIAAGVDFVAAVPVSIFVARELTR